MKKIAVVIAAAAFSALTFFAGYQANTNVEVQTKKVAVMKDKPVEHCVYSVIKKFPTSNGEQIPECDRLTRAQQDKAYEILSIFTDSAVDEFGN